MMGFLHALLSAIVRAVSLLIAIVLLPTSFVIWEDATPAAVTCLVLGGAALLVALSGIPSGRKRIRVKSPRDGVVAVMENFDSMSSRDIAAVEAQIDVVADERFCLEALEAAAKLPAVNTLNAIEELWGDALMAEECPGIGRKVLAFCRKRFLDRADAIIAERVKDVEAKRTDRGREKAAERLLESIGDALHDVDESARLEKKWDKRLSNLTTGAKA